MTFTARVSEMIEKRRLVVRNLSDIEPQEVSWLWPGRIARGAYQTVMGMPDTGKTSLVLDCIARLSVGRTWPDGTACPQGRSLIMTAEDNLAYTIRRRLDILGADPTQITVVDDVRDKNGLAPFTLDRHRNELEETLENVKPLLFFMDPMSAYLGNTSSHNEAAVRGLLGPLKGVLERQNVTLLACAHLNKNQMQDVMYRMSGSVGLCAPARMGMIVGKHPHDPTRRVMAMMKHNLSAPPRSLDFTLGDDAGKFALTWHEDAPNITPDELLRSTSPDEKTAMDEAAEFLSDYLASGPANVGDIVKAARGNAISDPTLKRAKKRLNVQTTKTGFNNSSWAWRLPIPHTTPKGINIPSDPLRENIKKNVSQEKPVIPFAQEEGEL